MKLQKFLWVALLAAIGLAVSGAEILNDESPKKNFGFGKETQIRSVSELSNAVGFRITQETPYLVLLSDLHLYSLADKDKKGDVVLSKDIRGDLKKLIDLLNSFSPAPGMVVITGDLSHTGAADQYRELKEIFAALKPEIPVFAIPGNHDDPVKMSEILGGEITGKCVRNLGNWTLIGLATAKDGSLPKKEQQFLAQALAGCTSRPVILFTHHSPIQQPGWELVRPMREILAGAVENRTAATWFVSGHTHASFLARLHYDGQPEIPILTQTSSTSSFGYDTPSLRVMFLGKDQVAGTAIWRYSDPTAGFRIDPPVSEWPAYVPPPRDPNRALLEIGRKEQKEFVVERKGVGEHESYDYVDGDGRLLLALPLAQYAGNAPLFLDLDLESDYIVRAGSSEENLKEIFNSGKRKSLETLRWPIPSELQNGILYLEIRDRTPQDGFGAFIHEIRLMGKIAK